MIVAWQYQGLLQLPSSASWAPSRPEGWRSLGRGCGTWRPSRWGSLGQDRHVGYGYQPWRALLFLAAVVVVSCVLAVVLAPMRYQMPRTGQLRQPQAQAAAGRLRLAADARLGYRL
jgi:hypothetical protein